MTYIIIDNFIVGYTRDETVVRSIVMHKKLFPNCDVTQFRQIRTGSRLTDYDILHGVSVGKLRFEQLSNL